MNDENIIRASGGLLAPAHHYPKTYRETYRVKGVLRRWRFRRAGFSTEWTVEYDWKDIDPVRDSLPSFSALRGGVEIKP